MTLHERKLKPLPGSTARLPQSPSWLLLGYRLDGQRDRRLAAALGKLSLHTDGALPIAAVSSVGAARTSQAMRSAELEIPVLLDNAEAPFIDAFLDCSCSFIAAVVDGRIVKAACIYDRPGIIEAVQSALNGCGIAYIDPRRSMALGSRLPEDDPMLTRPAA